MSKSIYRGKQKQNPWFADKYQPDQARAKKRVSDDQRALATQSISSSTQNDSSEDARSADG